ncbi:MAG TPA: glycosyltransferase [Candidatus Binatia bacterium]|nr:glycosyltransferase [Candidatus Binatia bacterium]
MEAIADQILTTDKNFPEVSIIMPCLNEAATLAACIGKARRALNEQKIAGTSHYDEANTFDRDAITSFFS